MKFLLVDTKEQIVDTLLPMKTIENQQKNTQVHHPNLSVFHSVKITQVDRATKQSGTPKGDLELVMSIKVGPYFKGQKYMGFTMVYFTPKYVEHRGAMRPKNTSPSRIKSYYTYCSICPNTPSKNFSITYLK